MARVNWEAIKLDYVTGRVSYRNLAEQWGVSASVLMRRASAEKWYAQRSNYRRKTAEKGQKKFEDEQAKQIADFKDKLMLSACLVLHGILLSLEKMTDGLSGADAVLYCQ